MTGISYIHRWVPFESGLIACIVFFLPVYFAIVFEILYNYKFQIS